MDELAAATDLPTATTVILTAARNAGSPVILAMLAAALRQLEELAPASDGQVWEAYAAVLAAGTTDRISAGREP